MTDGSGLQFMRNRFYDAATGQFNLAWLRLERAGEGSALEAE